VSALPFFDKPDDEITAKRFSLGVSNLFLTINNV